VRRHFPALAAAALFIACAGYVGRTFRWGEIASILRGAEPAWLLAGGSLFILLFWLARSLRWQVLLGELGVRAGFWDLYFCTAIALSASTLTPFQSGEALKVEWLKRRSLSERLPGYGSFLLERLLDAVVLSCAAGVGAAYGAFGCLDRPSFWAALAGAVLLSVRLLLALRSRFAGLGWVRRLSLDAYAPRAVWVAAALTLGSWMLIALSWQVSLRSISLPLGLSRNFFMTGAISILNALSHVPGSWGVFEAGTAGFLRAFGLGEAQAQAGALVLRIQLLVVLLLGGLHLALWRALKAGPGRPP
jgi:uncharacterized membrane protein YbhN (UPF0104 family)